MKLHAKSIALFAGSNPDEVDLVVENLINSKYINLETAKNILKKIRNK